MYLIFDTGGTKTRIGISRDGTRVEKFLILQTPGNDYTHALQEFQQAALKLTGGSPVTAVGGGMPGTFNKETGQIIAAPNLPAWRGKSLRDDLQRIFHAPVFLENDTAGICLGEAIYGAGVGKRIVVYITVSTGIGGCRVVDQKVDANAMGFEPGHQVVDMSGPRCACGAVGHLEGIAGGMSLKKRYKKDPELIADEAVWDMVTHYLAAGLVNVLAFWSPDVIIMGGSIMKSLTLSNIEAKLRESVTIYDTLPALVAPQLGEEGGLLGALALIRSHGM